jgi:hypothetical protein
LKSFQVDAGVAVIAVEATQLITELIELAKQMRESVGDIRPCWNRQEKSPSNQSKGCELKRQLLLAE